MGSRTSKMIDIQTHALQRMLIAMSASVLFMLIAAIPAYAALVCPTLLLMKS